METPAKQDRKFTKRLQEVGSLIGIELLGLMLFIIHLKNQGFYNT